MSLLTLMASIPNYLAGNGDLGTWEPTNLFAGEAPIITDGFETAVDVQIYQVVAKTAAGKLTTLVYPPADDNPATVAIAITAQPGKTGQHVPVYTGGAFNHAALIWPAGCDTLEKRQALFDRTDIHIGNLY